MPGGLTDTARSFLSFSSSSTSFQTSSLPPPSQPHLEITVTPSSSAFFTGEPFRATIRFSNTHRAPAAPSTHPHPSSGAVASASATHLATPLSTARAPPPPLPTSARAGHTAPLHARQRQIGRHVPDTPVQLDTEELGQGHGAEAGPSRLGGQSGYPYSATTEDEARRAGWPRGASPPRDDLGVIRSPDAWRFGGVGQGRVNGQGGGRGHQRRTQSLALGQSISPQEMVWALSGGPPPPLPARRQPGKGIPRAHPHARQISIASVPSAMSPPPTTNALPSVPQDGSPKPSRPSLPRMISASSAGSSSSPYIDLSDDNPSLPTLAQPRTDGIGRPLASPYHTSPALSQSSTFDAPPPTHPYARGLKTERAACTVLWAYTRLVATFHPSNHYIPPDPLLPLRSLLLHQPVGAGSLSPAGMGSGATPVKSSRWQLSFGTGTIGAQAAPSLTGSLVGLASSLITGGQGGSLEEERKRAWNTKDLPVFETPRSLLGVDMRMDDVEEREFEYAVDVPLELPPSHRGRAYRFEYKVVVSLGVMLGKEQKVEEVEVPVRMWGAVPLDGQAPIYDVLRPVITTKDRAKVVEVASTELARVDSRPLASSAAKLESDSSASLDVYARHLLETLGDKGHSNDRVVPMSPSRSPDRRPSRRVRELTDPPTPQLGVPRVHGMNGDASLRRARKGSFVAGDDELAGDRLDIGSAGAVGLLSRQSSKASFDIAKDGELVAIFTLTKTTFRLGESLQGVVDMNAHPSRRVLRFSAQLESHDVIPAPLLPLSPRGGRAAQPRLFRVHAEHAAGYTASVRRLGMVLDVPTDATPGFDFGASDGNTADRAQPWAHGEEGGVRWCVKLSFLVASPSSGSAVVGGAGGAAAGARRGGGDEASNAVPMDGDGDNVFYAATEGLAPVVPVYVAQRGSKGHGSNGDGARSARVAVAGSGDKKMGEGRDGQEVLGYEEMRVELVECEIPVRVLPGEQVSGGRGVKRVL